MACSLAIKKNANKQAIYHNRVPLGHSESRSNKYVATQILVVVYQHAIELHKLQSMKCHRQPHSLHRMWCSKIVACILPFNSSNNHNIYTIYILTEISPTSNAICIKRVITNALGVPEQTFQNHQSQIKFMQSTTI